MNNDHINLRIIDAAIADDVTAGVCNNTVGVDVVDVATTLVDDDHTGVVAVKPAKTNDVTTTLRSGRRTKKHNYRQLSTTGTTEQQDYDIALLTIQNGDVNEQLFTPNDAAYQFVEYMFVTEQMNWKKGLSMFKTKGEAAITQELKQVHDMDGFEPRHWYELSAEQRKKTLRYLMYLKEKRCGKIKARGCADGRKQRIYMNKHDTSSPTIALAALMMTCVIDAAEERDVATVDIPGAFLQTDQPDGGNDEEVHVMIEGQMARLLATIDPPTYQRYVHHHRGRDLIYVKLKKALYGTLKAALLF